MKVQCACGTKYAFDVTPDMLRTPRTFVCQTCGRDNSASINELIRQAYGMTGAPTPATSAQPPAAPPPPKSPSAAPIRVAVARPHTEAAPVVAPVPPQPVQQSPRVRIQQHSANAPAETTGAAQAVAGLTPCMKHPGQMAAQKCMVCQKPLCPKCMEMFGYLCSSYCKGKAEAQKLDIPVYAGQKSVAERKYWRKTGLIFGAIVLVVGGFLGAWTWYAWIGSAPRVKFSVRMEKPGYSGQCRMVGTDQVVFLHGGRIARHDMKTEKEIWLRDLVDRQKIAEEAPRALERLMEGVRKAQERGVSVSMVPPTADEIREEMEQDAEASFHLYVASSNVWVSSSGKLTQYDWQTGQPGKEVDLDDGDFFADLDLDGDEILIRSEVEPGYEVIRHINLASGESHKEEIGKPSQDPVLAQGAAGGLGNQATLVRAAANRPAAGTTVASRGGSNLPPAVIAKAGLLGGNKRLNPTDVAARVQGLSRPERIALPAVLAANANQQRLLAQMHDLDEDDLKAALAQLNASSKGDEKTIVRDGKAFIEFGVKLLEEKKITRQAMKAPPQRSVLDGDMRVTQTAELANEMLNEWQRDLTGGVEVEDASRYQVTVARRGEKDSQWTGEVIGPPELLPLKTVNIVAAGKTMVVLDKTNKKLWESQLAYPMKASLASGFEDEDEDHDGEAMGYGGGPCVERDGTLYVFDQGVLAAFELADGKARWRLPSVGIAGLHFDGKGMLYVNTTTGSPEKLKYSQQVDVTEKTHNVVMKIDPANGKTLWSIQGEGLINYMSGKFIYTIEYSRSGVGGLKELLSGGESKSSGYLRIKRINPSNGRVMWEHFQQRGPLDLRIDGNTFQVLFRKEMQVLKFLSL